jgi:hypothetical protein
VAIAKRAAHLVAQGTCEGIEEALGWTDAWQMRRGVNWLVTRDGSRIVVRRGDAFDTPVATFSDPSGELRGCASPAPDAGIAVVCGDDELTAVAAEGARGGTTLISRGPQVAAPGPELAPGPRTASTSSP